MKYPKLSNEQCETIRNELNLRNSKMKLKRLKHESKTPKTLKRNVENSKSKPSKSKIEKNSRTPGGDARSRFPLKLF